MSEQTNSSEVQITKSLLTTIRQLKRTALRISTLPRFSIKLTNIKNGNKSITYGSTTEVMKTRALQDLGLIPIQSTIGTFILRTSRDWRTLTLTMMFQTIQRRVLTLSLLQESKYAQIVVEIKAMLSTFEFIQ